MAGPCVMDGDCTEFYMDGDNLRVDVVIDPRTDNDISCGLNGLFVPKNRMRQLQGSSLTPVPGVDGVSSGLGTVAIDVEDFIGNANGTPIELTTTTQLTYINNSTRTEICQFGFEAGQTEYNLRAGWDFRTGVKAGWTGPSALTPVSGFRFNTGLQTGLSAFDQSYVGTSQKDPFGITVPPHVSESMTVLAPGEYITTTFRLWASYLNAGLPNNGSSRLQRILIQFGAVGTIASWTQG